MSKMEKIRSLGSNVMNHLKHAKEKIQEYRIQKEQTKQDLYNFLKDFDNIFSLEEKENLIREWEEEEKRKKKEKEEKEQETQEKGEGENIHDISNRLLKTLSKKEIRSTNKILATKGAVGENLKKALLAPKKTESD